MSSSPRLPDLTAADASRRFVLRPGSTRLLVLGSDAPVVPGEAGPSADGAEVSWEGPVEVREQPTRPEEPAGMRRFAITACQRGAAVVRVGEMRWEFEIRGAGHTPEQTRDDTDAGWGESRSGHSRSWWEEQRPPHW